MREPTDIVERLRDRGRTQREHRAIRYEAAAEIEGLRARVADLHQQLALAERRLKIAETALREYADEKNWDGSRLAEWHRYPEPVYERGQQALKDMENVK